MRTVRFWFPPLAWAAVIFTLSSHPRLNVSTDYWTNFAFFKLLHAVEYYILFMLTIRAITNTTTLSRKESALLAFIVAVFYAISDEIHQTFVPTREGRVRDVVFDTIGASLAWYTLWKLLPILPMRLKLWVKKLGLP